MSAEWQQVSLGDLFKVKHGFAFKGEFFTEKPQRHVLVTPGNFAIGGGFQNAKQKYYCGPIPEDYVLKPGQVVVTMTDLSKQSDTLGYAALVPDDNTAWLHNQRVGLLEFFGKIEADPIFVSYLLRTHEYRSWVVGSATGTTVKHTSPSRIEAYKCKIPPIHEQQNIANTLGSIDNKIDLNRRINQTLEAMAQAIFKSWFVDFDPVKAKIAAKQQGHDPLRAAMCVISGKTDDELDQLPRKHFDSLAATAALFPDELADSELGEIPEGWSAGTFKQCCLRVESGGTPSRKEPTCWGGSIPWLTSGEVRDVVVLDTKEKITREGLDSSSAKLWPPMTTVVAMYGATAGQVCLIAEEMTANQACCALIPRAEFGTFVFIAARQSIQQLAERASGSAQQNLNKSLVESYAHVVPCREVAEKFEKATTGLLRQWILNQREAATLGMVRDTLLPKLLSGELSIGTTGELAASSGAM